MKNIYLKRYLLLLFIAVGALFQNCKKVDETYPEPPKRVYIAQAVPVGTTRLNITASGKKTVSPVTFRVFVNTHYSTDVTATYTLSGTAVASVDFVAPTTTSVVIPANTYFVDVPLTVINNPVFTSGSKTLIVTLNNNAPEGFMAGLGYAFKYNAFTYTITP